MNEEDSVNLFKKFLRQRTISGEGPTNGAYFECSQLFRKELELLGFKVQIFEFVKDKPVVIGTLRGEDPSLPGILLNGHYDVVPAKMDSWTKDPFKAEEDSDGRIFARGTQDMKCVCVQYLIAIGRLLKEKKHGKFLRTLHITYVPDEEIGGVDGMYQLLQSKFFKEEIYPIGMALDEGLANPADAFTVFYGERMPLWIFVTVNGPTGHGSRFVENTAIERLLKICGNATEFRKKEEEIFKGKRASEGCSHCEAKKLGDVTTLNITFLQGGVPMNQNKREYVDGEEKISLNVIPTQAKCGMDIRVPPHVPIEKITGMLDEWTKEQNATWRYAPWTNEEKIHAVTSIDRSENPWWGIFQDSIQEFGAQLEPEVFPAGTDSRFIRQIGIPAFGFSPMRNIPILLHEHDEYITRQCFLEGIKVYETLLLNLLEFQQHQGDEKRVKMMS